MNIDERSNQIFIELLNHPQLTSSMLTKQFDISRGQLNYALQKINEVLEFEKLTKIQRRKNGQFIIPQDVQLYYKNKINQDIEKDYLFSNKARYKIIELMLLSREDYLSLNHFIADLKLSKNTILRDMKEVKGDLENYHLILDYSRKNGYYIEGSEWNKRKLLGDLLADLLDTSNGLQPIVDFSNVDLKDVESMKNKLLHLEMLLNISYVENRLEILSLLMNLILRRIKKGKKIEYNFEVNYQELMDTREYVLIGENFSDIAGLNEQEKIYLTLLLLTTNQSKADTLSEHKMTEMRLSLIEFINTFEKNTGLIIEDREALLERLLIHMRAAYYRIKYKLNLQNNVRQAVDNSNLSSLFSLIKNSIKPLEDFFREEIPDIEIFFISLFFGSSIFNRGLDNSSNKKKTAVTVCPNALSMSILLESTLSNIFPEIDFIGGMSTRDFYKGDFEADYVFSAVPLKTDRKVYVVNNYLSLDEREQLRDRVLSPDFREKKSLSPQKIIEVVKKYADITDEEALYNDLLDLYKPRKIKKFTKQELSLSDLLTEDNIQILEEDDWTKLLEKVSKPLEDKGDVSGDYLSDLKEQLADLPEHIILRNKLALPHTAKGVNKLGLSLGILPQGIYYNNQKIKTVILLASNDKDSHVNLLFEIMELAGDDLLLKLEQSTSKEEVKLLLDKFSKEYRRSKFD